jgi:hypothetical protein
MTHDRNYWRAVPTADLIEAARDSREELAIALGERLEDIAAELARVDLYVTQLELDNAKRGCTIEDLENDIELVRLDNEAQAVEISDLLDELFYSRT